MIVRASVHGSAQITTDVRSGDSKPPPDSGEALLLLLWLIVVLKGEGHAVDLAN